MKDSETPGASSVIVEPMSMTIYLARNLSPWCHDIPDIDVHGKLMAVEASLVIVNITVINSFIHSLKQTVK
jgi:hypothetical protein